MSAGNLKAATGSGTQAHFLPSTVPVGSGKWYAEFTINSGSGAHFGAVPVNQSFTSGYLGSAAGNGSAYSMAGSAFNYNNAGSIESSLTTSTTGDVIGVALDLDDSTGKLYVYKNGTQITNAQSDNSFTTYNLLDVSPLWTISIGNNATWDITANFGQRAFAYTPPTGFKALNTANLPAPTVKDGSKNFNTLLYTGTGGTKAVSGAGFQPEFVWIKNRSRASSSHVLVDAVRGATKALSSNLTNSEVTTNGTDDFRSFDSDGFTVGDSSNYFVNSVGDTHAAWCWDAGGSGSSNTDGSITSTVSANPTAGFSIVSYTGTGANATVGHGLGVPLDMVITKPRNGGDHSWGVYHRYGSSGAETQLQLNSTTAPNEGTSFWNGTHPTSTVFTVNTASATNNSGSDIIAYCFAEVEGYSKFGSYTGNGSTDGPFVYCGFRPS